MVPSVLRDNLLNIPRTPLLLMPSKNAPCPCGSGKKFKNCCLQHERQRLVAATRQSFATSVVAGMPVLSGIFVFAVALRLGLFSQMRNSVLATVPILDGAYYYAWAQRIAAGNWLGGTDVYPMSPGYPYLLAVLFRILGESLAAVIVVQCFIGALSCVIVYSIARRFCSVASSAVSGALLASYGASVLYPNILNKASWIEFLNSSALLAFLFAVDVASPWVMVIPGLLIGASAQFRPSVLLFLPLAAAYLWFPGRHSPSQKSKSMARSGALLLGAGLLIVPVALRNRAVGGEWVLTTAHGGMNFYTGNNAQSAAPYRPLPFARTDPQFEQKDFLAEAQRRAGRNLTPAEASRFWYAETWKLIGRDKFGWVEILAKKLRLILSNYEQPINQNLYFYAENFSFLKLPSLIGYWLIAPLGLLGLMLSLRVQSLMPLHLYFLAQVASLVVFFVVAEYRHPLTVALVIYAAYAIDWFREKINVAEWRNLAMGLIVAGVIGGAGRASIEDAKGFRQDMAVAWGNMGTSYVLQSHWEQAASAFRQSLAIAPDFGEAHYGLGECLLNQNRAAEAKFHIAQGIRFRPGLAPQHYRLLLAQAYAQLGERENAINVLNSILAMYPNDTASGLNLLVIYRQLGRRAEAAKLLEKMLSFDPVNIRTLILATEWAILDKDQKRIYDLLPRLAAGAPADPNVRNLIGMALVKSGHYREARSEFEKALALMPGHADAAANLRRVNRMLAAPSAR